MKFYQWAMTGRHFSETSLRPFIWTPNFDHLLMSFSSAAAKFKAGLFPFSAASLIRQTGEIGKWTASVSKAIRSQLVSGCKGTDVTHQGSDISIFCCTVFSSSAYIKYHSSRLPGIYIYMRSFHGNSCEPCRIVRLISEVQGHTPCWREYFGPLVSFWTDLNLDIDLNNGNYSMMVTSIFWATLPLRFT